MNPTQLQKKKRKRRKLHRPPTPLPPSPPTKTPVVQHYAEVILSFLPPAVCSGPEQQGQQVNLAENALHLLMC